MNPYTPESRLQILLHIERLIERIVRLAVRHLALQLNRADPDFDRLSDVILVIGRILEIRVQVRELIRQATMHGPDATSADREAEDLSALALQRTVDHEDAEDAPVSREVPPPRDTGE